MEDYQPKTSHDILVDIGRAITAERERQGLTLNNVSQRLRILEEHLSYIETGQLERLPAMTYVIGYVRSYARLLGLDDRALCAELKASLTTEEDKPEYKFIESKSDKQTGAGRVALAALIAGILIYGGWYSFTVSSTSSPKTTEVAEAVTPQQTEAVLVQDNVENTTSEAEQQAISEEIVVEETASADNEVIAETVEETQDVAQTVASNVVEETQEEVQSEEPVIENEASPSVTNAYAVNRSPDAEIIIEAIANSWVEVTRADGTSVTSRLMRLGDTYLIPSDEDLYLTTGNAGGLNIRMGAEDPFTLGSWGEALRELPLNKAVITERY